MNNVPCISIIVPVYKAEKYLNRCVDSLLAQTFKDFEVLLIDDGSPDRSGEMCDEYARKDSRVRVFHKENGGVSSARQMGIDNARGEYTIHADPDDWVEPDMLEGLYKKAKETDADMVICDYYVELDGRTIYKKQQPEGLDHNVVLRNLFQQLHGSCWNKLIRRACYSQYGVKFPLELRFCEDLYVNVSLLVHDIKVSYLARAFYHYDVSGNDNSLVRNRDLEQSKTLMTLLSEKLGAEYSAIALPMLAYGYVKRAIMVEDCTARKFKGKYGRLTKAVMSASHRSPIAKALFWFACRVNYKMVRTLLIIGKKWS